MMKITVTMQSLKDPSDTVTLTDVSYIKNYWSTERHGSDCLEIKSCSRGMMNINLQDYRVVIEQPKQTCD